MQFFVGIDVSLETSSICIIDERGVILKKATVLPSTSATGAARWSTSGRRWTAFQVALRGIVREGFYVSVLESRHRLPSNGRFTGDAPPEHRYEADLQGSTAELLRI